MSLIPDQILARVLLNGLRAIRTDPLLLDDLLENLTQRDLKQFKEFFTTNSIDISFNFPRAEALKVPAIIIQLQSETEAQAFLGDQLEYGIEAPEQDQLFDTVEGDGSSASDMGNLPEKLYGDIGIARSINDPVTGYSRVYWTSNTNVTELTQALTNRGTGGVDLYVIKGQGVGQKYSITTITNSYIDINGTFAIMLDSSSVVDLRKPNNPIATAGEPSRIFREDDIWLSRKGVNYDAQYQLSILAGSQQEVLHLFTIIKALFISQRVFLEAQGLMNFAMSASDFSPRSDYTPAIVYQRAMTCKFTYTFSFVERLTSISRVDFTIKTCSLGDEVTSFSIDLQD